MYFNLSWEAILRIVGRRVLHTRLSRDVVRKSGFRLGRARASVQGAPVLCIPPVNPNVASPGTYWHPVNLPHYITRRPLNAQREVRVSVPVAAIEPGASATIGASYSSELDSPLVGWETLASMAFTEAGFYVSDWEPIPEEARVDEVYIAMFLQAHTSIAALFLGQAEVRIR